MRSPVRLVRNIDAGRLFDIFLATSVVTVLATRFYLHLTGYPQVGGNLHIAHLLPGGIAMLTALLVMLGTINRSSRDLAAYVGGIGFGLFWDELGKFITKDNNYFYRPTVGLLYASFVTLYLVLRYVARRSYQPEDYLANATDLIMEGTIGELDPREYSRAKELLAQADSKHPMYPAVANLLEHAKPTKHYQPFVVDRLIAAVHTPARRLAQKPLFSRILLGVFYAYGLGLVITFLFVLVGGSHQPIKNLLGSSATQSNSIATLSAVATALCIVRGAWQIQTHNMHAALRSFETALLINIFITQVFLFLNYQLTAIISLIVALLLLYAVRILLSETNPTH
jgi:hypothetical protein